MSTSHEWYLEYGIYARWCPPLELINRKQVLEKTLFPFLFSEVPIKKKTLMLHVEQMQPIVNIALTQPTNKWKCFHFHQCVWIRQILCLRRDVGPGNVHSFICVHTSAYARATCLGVNEAILKHKECLWMNIWVSLLHTAVCRVDNVLALVRS
jgi:hypothetical protein